MKKLVIIFAVLFSTTLSFAQNTTMWSLKDSIESVKSNAKANSISKKELKGQIKELKATWFNEYTRDVYLSEDLSADDKKFLKDLVSEAVPEIKTIEMVEVSSDFDQVIIFDRKTSTLQICYLNSFWDAIQDFVLYMNFLDENTFKVEYLKITHGLFLSFDGEIDNFTVNMTVNYTQKLDVIDNYIRLNKIGINEIQFSLDGQKKIVDKNGKKTFFCGNPSYLFLFPSEIK